MPNLNYLTEIPWKLNKFKTVKITLVLNGELQI